MSDDDIMLFTRDELIIFLNEFYYKGSKNIEISYSPVGCIFSIDLDKRKVKSIDSKEYESKINEFKEKLGEVDKRYLYEIPSSSIIKDCLYISGVLEPKNINDIKYELVEMSNRDLMRGDRPLVIGFDTNALRRRVNKHIERILKDNKTIKFCLSSVVSDELYRQYDKKHSYELNPPIELSFMKDFGNSPTLNARMARLGAVEYRRLKELKYTHEVKGGEKDNPDLMIVKSYESLKADNDVVLVSGDKHFHDLAQSKGMRIIEAKEPYDIKSEIYLSWEGVCSLIYVASIFFGNIDINGVSVNGIWTGKNADNWNYEKVNVMAKGEMKDRIKKFRGILGI